MWGIIGGSGFEKFDSFRPVEDLNPETPFGQASPGIKRVEFEGKELVFIPRHGSTHQLLPSEVNYRANIYALKNAGVSKVLAFSAVGSLQNEYPPGDMVVPSQFIDRTKGLRASSFCGEGVVGHVSLAEPVSESLMQFAQESGDDFEFNCHFKKTLVIMEGPQFSTKAESHLYRSWNADIIGMTAYPEYALAREAGLAYLNCCFITDYDCWKDDIPHVTVDQVIRIMQENNKKAFQVARKFVHAENPEVVDANEKENGLASGLMSKPEAVDSSTQNWINVLTH